MKITDIYYFSGTHWDREWYQTFQGFRARLVRMIDDLLDYMEKEPKFETFHFDGQTIVLEDYIQIAPENEQRLKKLIADGRIKIGPWYNMPDEFLVSGESLIRNLAVGAKLCKKWGAEPWKVGYICDIFGHIAQTPQIFSGFGIKSAVLGRGTNEEYPTYFDWTAPDGSSCTTFKLDAEGGYGSFFLATSADGEDKKQKIEKYISERTADANAPVLILMDAQDHQPAHKDTPEYLDIIKKLCPEAEVHHCDLSEAFAKPADADLPKIFGELNKTAMGRHQYLHLITNTLSSYYTHKKANDECQNRLEKVIEPMMAYLALAGKPIRRSYVDLAYKYLLMNHPHDSICGCSVEQVHKDMLYRFAQTSEICDMLTEEFLHAEKPQEGTSGEYVLRIYNPLPFERRETVNAEVILDKNFKCAYAEPFDYETVFSFKLVDSKGNEIPYGIAKNIKKYSKRVYEQETVSGECYEIAFEAQLPAGGYAEYKLVPSEKPSRYLEKMTSGNNFAENDYIRMEITQNGEISIFDKKTKAEYKNLCAFADDGEIGDGWYHANPMNDFTVYSGNDARIEKILSAPSRCVFRVTKYIEVPACMENTAHGYRRSADYVKLPIMITAGLSKNARYADINVEIDNNARDHRLHLLLPTGVDGEEYFAGQTFYCCTRKTGIDYRTQDWREHEQYEKQMNGIVGKRGKDGCGLAFVAADGLHECAVHESGDMNITLLRAFGRTVMTMGEDGGQLLGKLSYSFLLVPLDNDISYSGLLKLQSVLSAKPIALSAQTCPEYAPSEKSFMKIEGDDISISIIKQPEDGAENTVIVRVFNSSDKPAEGKICFERDVKKASETNLNEENIGEVRADGKSVSVKLPAWKIGTYRIEM